MFNFNNKKTRRVVSSVIIIILVLAMVVPTLDVYKRQILYRLKLTKKLQPIHDRHFNIGKDNIRAEGSY